MSDGQGPVGEEDLHALVDGRLPASRRSLVERHLSANPALRQRLADWSAQADSLRRIAREDDAATRAAILARLSARRRAVTGPGGRRAVAAGLVLALGIGGAAGWVARGDGRPTEIARLDVEAASAFRVFANDPTHPVEVSSNDRGQLRAWLTGKLGRRVALPDLAPLGYELMGGRVLAAMYGPAALLVYRDGADNRITVYVQPMRVGAPASMRPMRAKAVDGYAWIEHQVGYTVMADGERARLHAVADQVLADTAS